MSVLTNWNDVIALNPGDKINFENKTFKIDSKDIDEDRGGIRIIFTLNNDEEVIINHLGEVTSHLGDFNLSDNKLKKISGGGKRKTLRKHYKKSNYKRKKQKTTRRHYK